jgi:hypothetical protein
MAHNRRPIEHQVEVVNQPMNLQRLVVRDKDKPHRWMRTSQGHLDWLAN